MANRRENLEQILQTCLEEIQSGQETVDSVLARYPERADEIRPLLETASWLQGRREAASPGLKFVGASRRRLEARLELEKAASLTKAPREARLGRWETFASLFPRIHIPYQYAIATLLLIFLLLSTSSVAAASQRAIPGDALYPVKTTLERMHLAMTFGTTRRAQLQVDFAERRLIEIHSLVIEKRYEYLNSTINQFEAQANQASLPLQSLANSNASQAKELANKLTNAINEETIILPALAQSAPVGAQDEIKRLINLTGEVKNQAESIEAGPSETPTPTPRPSTDTVMPGAPTSTVVGVAGITPVPETTFTQTSTPSPEYTLVAPTGTATPYTFPTPTEPLDTGWTPVPTGTEVTKTSPVISFTTRNQTVSAARGTLLITVQLEDDLGDEIPASQDVSLPFSISGSAKPDSDFTVSNSPLVISAGNSRADIVVNLKDDGVVEPDETIILTMGTPSNAVQGSPSTHTITITDGPTVFFTLASQSVHEIARSADIEVQLMPAQATDVSVPFSLGGTAIQDKDYTLKDGSPLVIPAGQTKAYISLSLLADGLDEPDKTIDVTLGSPSGAVLSLPSAQQLTLIDDDPLPEVTFVQPDQSVGENAGYLSIQMQLSAASSLPITVPLSLSGSATPGIDYLFSQSSVVIPPGITNASFTLQVVDDLTPESYETVVIAMGQPTNAVLGTPSAHLLTLVDNDPLPEVNFVQSAQSVEESVGSVSVQVQLSVASSLPITVPLNLSGSATPGIDYLLSQSSVVIPPGSTSASFTLQVVDDLLPESYEMVVIAMGQPTNAVLGTPTAHLLTLVDNDPLPEVSFVQSDQSVEESVGSVSVQVQLSTASSLPITVPLSLSGSATPGIDYLFSQSSVVIPPGSTNASFTVQVIDDTERESSETIVIAMGVPTNAVSGVPNTQSITILPNDQPTCEIFASNPISFPADGRSLEWTLSNMGSDTLVFTQLTISWPTLVPFSPNLDRVFFDTSLIFEGNLLLSPQTITLWLSPDSSRSLTSSPSTIDIRFNRALLPGTYTVTLVFRNITQGFDCAPVNQSIDHP